MQLKRRFVQAAVVVGALAFAVNAATDERADYETWRAERLARLTQPLGWLSLTGLHFLKPGINTIGSDPTNTVVLRAGPEKLGTIDLRDGRYVLTATPEMGIRVDGKNVGEIELNDDSQGALNVIEFGAQRASIVKRGEPALRVRDPDAPSRLRFRGLEYFDYDPSWAVDARFEAHPPGRVIEITTVIGTIEKNANPGRVVFSHGGESYALEAIREADSDALFLIVADATNARDTYGAGRFVYAPLPINDRVRIDFNRLYNPPCAFTEFSTCPLPPLSNRLRTRIVAGEKRYIAHEET